MTYDDLSRTARRQLAARTSVASAGVRETTSGNPSLPLPTADRIVRLPELLAIFQISRTTAYAWQKAGLLPRSVALGPRARGWKLSDIARHLASLGEDEQ
ncbi:helix-turn-helix transcriptional regulator [Burkholderia sp. WAC0059]|uniref:helix-turn-helix transcriptional regulator n=1 Tax=Burkholderia sp. WAC0059 TaxID=2066022 RepID=UPI0015E14890|nr:AlpA family phage regulatory protein [Burkholderia sp. WAC0059]